MSWAEGEVLPGTSSLANDLDKKLLVILRDGRKLIGILRSFDHFANIVLESTIERKIVGLQYCDVSLGIYLVRGENVVLIGAMDPNVPDLPSNMICVSKDEIEKAQKEEKDALELKGSMRKRMEFLDLE